MSATTQFDVNLGGTQNLPSDFTLGNFARARFEEITALTQALDGPRKSGQVFQRLPRHMQRRAMSHNSKRLPRRLREAYNQQLDKCGANQKKKRPSRKFRRRPRNLLEEYNRRQRKHVWLETHIWHAKRFHMVERWGYKLPLRPTDKSFRACYRATAHHCLLQDVSYYCCIELTGPIDILLSGLKLHTSTDCGPTFAAAAYLKGSREGSTMFFQSNAYPHMCVGPVSFSWRPQEEADCRTVWLWVHPAFYKEYLQQLTATFALHSADNGEPALETCVDFSSKVEQAKLATRNVPFIRVPQMCSADGQVRLALLKDTLSRLRLTGPLSQAVLTQALRVTEDREEVWRAMGCCASPDQVPPHMVLGVTLRDPRLYLPSKRTKAVPPPAECDDQQLLRDIPPGCCTGDIWNVQLRDEATARKLSSAAVAELCGRRLVPEGPVLRDEEADKHTLPALLIQRPGNRQPGRRLGLGSGWDIVLPAGYAMPVWLALVFRGARAGGLRDADCQRLEEGCPDLLAPDTAAGREEAHRLQLQKQDQHFRKPPCKRLNFIKLGISSPFACRWDILVREWCGQDCSWFVWRAREAKDQTTRGCLVPVIVRAMGQGFPVRCAIICVPDANDKRDGALEPVHPDERQAGRKEMRKEHKARLRRERKLRRKGIEDVSHPVEPDYSTAMQNAWLPETKAVKDSCSRTVIGFVTAGNFCFSEARGVGQGYVVLEGLRFLQSKNNGDKVLFRNPTSRQYRFGKLFYQSGFAVTSSVV